MRRLRPALLVLVFFLGCHSAASEHKAVEDAEALGDAATEERLRVALDRHPSDVRLLIKAAEFYMRPAADEYYRPRLALHYAMRADKAANYASDDVGRTLMRAYRAAGGVQGTEIGRRLIADGLAAVNHPDRDAPKRLKAADPDLLEPTLANILEQKRRDEARAKGYAPCADGYVHVPPGTYPGVRGGPDLEVEGFCVERPSATGVAQIEAVPARRESICGALGHRTCTTFETAVACGPLRTVVGRHTACEDERVVRCCSDPQPL